MGYFSWITQDTNRSIANCNSSRKPFSVTMTDDKGNKWEENHYEGYGIFGGKDYYQLVAEMNGFETRSEGISVYLGIRGIRNRITNQMFLSSNVDFFNWGNELLINSMSANELLELDEWDLIHITFPNAKFPSLTENHDSEWLNERPDDCPDQGVFYEKEDTKYILTEGSINDIKINEKIFNEDLHEYKIIDREGFIDELIGWIGEQSHDSTDKPLMMNDLKMLMKVSDEYLLSSGNTNDYLYQGCSDFDRACEELLELHNSIREKEE